MTNLYTFAVRTGCRQPVSDVVRLDVAGGYIEVTPTASGIEVRFADLGLPARLVVVPVASNVVRVETVEERP